MQRYRVEAGLIVGVGRIKQRTGQAVTEIPQQAGEVAGRLIGEGNGEWRCAAEWRSAKIGGDGLIHGDVITACETRRGCNVSQGQRHGVNAGHRIDMRWTDGSGSVAIPKRPERAGVRPGGKVVKSNVEWSCSSQRRGIEFGINSLLARIRCAISSVILVMAVASGAK